MWFERTVGYGALASAGVFIAHAFGYLIAYSSAADRSVAMAGHAYFGTAAWVVIPLASLLVAAAIVRATARASLAEFRPWAVSAAAMTGFLALEVLERVPSGQSHAVFTEPGVLAGLALSLPVGWALAKLARGIEHIVDAIVNAPPAALVPPCGAGRPSRGTGHRDCTVLRLPPFAPRSSRIACSDHLT